MVNLADLGPDTPVEYSDKSEYPVDAPGRRSTLLARAREEEEDNEAEALFKDKFKELLKNPNTLYIKVIKIMTNTRRLYTNCKNYRQ
jgi:hypothetical protein